MTDQPWKSLKEMYWTNRYLLCHPGPPTAVGDLAVVVSVDLRTACINAYRLYEILKQVQDNTVVISQSTVFV